MLALCVFVICGCAGPQRPRRAAAGETNAQEVAAARPVADADRDDDLNAVGEGSDNNSVLDYGRPADPSEWRSATTAVRRYYAAALMGDGAAACTLVSEALEESMAEDYGYLSPGPAYSSGGRTCPQVMTLLFRHFHTRLAAELPLLKVARIGIVRHRAVAVLAFGAMPERQLPLVRERGSWKIGTPLDGELP